MITDERLSLNYSELALNAYLSSFLEEHFMGPIEEFLGRPSKGVRFELVRSTFIAFSEADTPVTNGEDLGIILEALHSASLIVDDIQDDSVERRKGPCLHVQEGMPKALNAGNWLYFWALKQVQKLNVSETIKYQMLTRIHDTLFQGHIGQAFDLSEPVTSLPQKEVNELCETTMRLKTGALMGLGVELGALMAGVQGAQLQRLRKMGMELGVVLQMFDDIKNIKVCSDKKCLEDIRNLRPSYLWAFAAENCTDVEYEGLKNAINSEATFIDWCGKVKLFSRAYPVIETRFNNLIANIENQKLKSTFSKQFEILKDAYENP